jgi:hypothetical protein
LRSARRLRQTAIDSVTVREQLRREQLSLAASSPFSR